ncbi:MAG: histidine phosphatase family protein [bacterium]|nr:histidine phosphatase family protein [bacterium]
MYELILIRHGETIFNSQERLQGGQDSALTKRGEEEAQKLGAAMRSFCGPIHAWYVSPQGRARQTSGIIRSELGPDHGAPGTRLPEERAHDAIVEIRCGDWEGLRRDEIPPAELKRVHLSTHEAYPNGESIADVSKRCEAFLKEWQTSLPALAELQADPKLTSAAGVHRTVVVSHGNLIRCLGGALSGLGPDFAVRAMKNNTAVSRFFIREHPAGTTGVVDHTPMYRMLTWNNISHLHGGDPFFSV